MKNQGTGIYLVSYGDVDVYDPRILIGPSRKDWAGYCYKFLDEACRRAVALERSRETINSATGEKILCPSWVNWYDVLDQLVEVLVERGYQHVKPAEAYYTDSLIHPHDGDLGLPPEGRKLIRAHNRRVRTHLDKCLAESRKARESKSSLVPKTKKSKPS